MVLSTSKQKASARPTISFACAVFMRMNDYILWYYSTAAEIFTREGGFWRVGEVGFYESL
jgi:hypothetical protein